MNGDLRPYIAFHAALHSTYQAFVSSLEDNCRALVRHHLDAATSGFGMSLVTSLENLSVAEDMDHAMDAPLENNENRRTGLCSSLCEVSVPDMIN